MIKNEIVSVETTCKHAFYFATISVKITGYKKPVEFVWYHPSLDLRCSSGFGDVIYNGSLIQAIAFLTTYKIPGISRDKPYK